MNRGYVFEKDAEVSTERKMLLGNANQERRMGNGMFEGSETTI